MFIQSTPHAQNVIAFKTRMLVGTLPSLHLQLRALVVRVPWRTTLILVIKMVINNNYMVIKNKWNGQDLALRYILEFIF
jgi:hypothetical protein